MTKLSRFLVGTVPVVGHVSPAVPIVRQLVDQGHEVWWYTGQLFKPTVEATGAKFVPMTHALDFSEIQNVPTDWVEARAALKGLAQLKFDLRNFFIDAAIGQVKDYAEILQQFPADGLLADTFFLGAAWTHELGGPPWAELGISVLAHSSRDTAPFGLGLPPDSSPKGRLRNLTLQALFKYVGFRDIAAQIDKNRAQVGLPPTTQPFFGVKSPFLYLAGTLPEFEYPRSDLPPQVHFIGPLQAVPPPGEFTPPDWWGDLQQEIPIVHVSQGTVATDPTDLLAPTLQALAQENVLVVATTGKATDDVGLADLPANARVARFLPYAHLLPHVDVMVSNGGYGGVQMALAAGIPLVVAGKTEDKPEVCARVAWSGVGIDLNTKTPNPEQIKDAVRTLLTQPDYQKRAHYFQTKIAQYDAPQYAVTLLEQLAISQQPILGPS
ncbi:MAG: nucleotide disphospho-sugar-binding domain-containing protein [Cyanobacteria bacterium P01_D01_bin.44]